MLTFGTPISTIAKTAGLSRQAIYRLKDNPAWAEGVLATWAAWRSCAQPRRSESGRHLERYAIFAGSAQFGRRNDA